MISSKELTSWNRLPGDVGLYLLTGITLSPWDCGSRPGYGEDAGPQASDPLEKVDTVTLAQRDDRFFPVSLFPDVPSQALCLSTDICRTDLDDFYLKELFDRIFDLFLISPAINLERKLVALILLNVALLGYQGSSDDLIDFFHLTSTPSIMGTAAFSMTR